MAVRRGSGDARENFNTTCKYVRLSDKLEARQSKP